MPHLFSNVTTAQQSTLPSNLDEILKPEFARKLSKTDVLYLLPELIALDVNLAHRLLDTHKLSTSEIITTFSAMVLKENNPKTYKMILEILDSNFDKFKPEEQRLIRLVMVGEDLHSRTILKTSNNILKALAEFVRMIKIDSVDRLRAPKISKIAQNTARTIKFIKQLHAISQGQYSSADLEKALSKRGIQLNSQQQGLLNLNDYLSHALVTHLLDSTGIAQEERQGILNNCAKRKLDFIYHIELNELRERLIADIIPRNTALTWGLIKGILNHDNPYREAIELIQQRLDNHNQSSCSLFKHSEEKLASNCPGAINKTIFLGDTACILVSGIDHQMLIIKTQGNEAKKLRGNCILGPVLYAGGALIGYQKTNSKRMNFYVIKSNGRLLKINVAGVDPDKNSVSIGEGCITISTFGSKTAKIFKDTWHLAKPCYRRERLKLSERNLDFQIIKDPFVSISSIDSSYNYIGRMENGQITPIIDFDTNGNNRIKGQTGLTETFIAGFRWKNQTAHLRTINKDGIIRDLELPIQDFKLAHPRSSLEMSADRLFLKLADDEKAKIFEVQEDSLREISNKLPVNYFVENTIVMQEIVYFICRDSETQKYLLVSTEGERLSEQYDQLSLATSTDQKIRLIATKGLDIFELVHFPHDKLLLELQQWRKLTKQTLELFLLAKIIDPNLLNPFNLSEVMRQIQDLAQATNDPELKDLIGKHALLSAPTRQIQIIKEQIKADPTLLKQAPTRTDPTMLVYFLESHIKELKEQPANPLEDLGKGLRRLAEMITMPLVLFSFLNRSKSLGGGREQLLDRSVVLTLDKPFCGFLAGGIYFNYDPKTFEYDRSAPHNIAAVSPDPMKVYTVNFHLAGSVRIQDLPSPIDSQITRLELSPRKSTSSPTKLEYADDGLAYCQTTAASKHLSYCFSMTSSETNQKIENTHEAYYNMLKHEPILYKASQARVQLPDDLQSFCDAIRTLNPLEQVNSIRHFIRKILFYDLDNSLVAERKSNSSLAKKLEIMRETMLRIHEDDPKLLPVPKEKVLAGVCIDTAELTIMLCSEVRLAAGLALGFQVDGKKAYKANSHAIAVVAMPLKDGSIKLLEVDSTPPATNSVVQDLLDFAFPQPTIAKEDKPSTFDDNMITETPTSTINYKQTNFETVNLDNFQKAMDWLLYSNNSLLKTLDYSGIFEFVKTAPPSFFEVAGQEHLGHIQAALANYTLKLATRDITNTQAQKIFNAVASGLEQRAQQ